MGRCWNAVRRVTQAAKITAAFAMLIVVGIILRNDKDHRQAWRD